MYDNIPGSNWVSKEKSGWYEISIPKERYASTREYYDAYISIVEWVWNKVDNPVRHSRWILESQKMIFRFRYERDYMMCMLRWS